jgi:hypothetical protein
MHFHSFKKIFYILIIRVLIIKTNEINFNILIIPPSTNTYNKFQIKVRIEKIK